MCFKIGQNVFKDCLEVAQTGPDGFSRPGTSHFLICFLALHQHDQTHVNAIGNNNCGALFLGFA